MRLIYVGEKYESKIYVIDGEKLIFKLDCMCGDFVFRRKKKIGELADVKYFAEPCKHLKPFVKRLIEQGYKLKKPKEMIGADKLTMKLRKRLKDRAGFKCENPGCHETENLEVHRMTRGSVGGKYNMTNCVVLCAECHKLRHFHEFK